MRDLYVFGAGCPILWVLAILELVSGFKFIRDYKTLKLPTSKSGAIRSFILSGVLFALAIYSTVKLISAMKGLG